MKWQDKKEDGLIPGTNKYMFNGYPHDIHTFKDGETGIYYLVPSENRKTYCGEFYNMDKLKRIAAKKKKEAGEDKKKK